MSWLWACRKGQGISPLGPHVGRCSHFTNYYTHSMLYCSCVSMLWSLVETQGTWLCFGINLESFKIGHCVNIIFRCCEIVSVDGGIWTHIFSFRNLSQLCFPYILKGDNNNFTSMKIWSIFDNVKRDHELKLKLANKNQSKTSSPLKSHKSTKKLGFEDMNTTWATLFTCKFPN